MSKRGESFATLYFTLMAPSYKGVKIKRTLKKYSSRRISLNIGDVYLKPNKTKKIKVWWDKESNREFIIKMEKPVNYYHHSPTEYLSYGDESKKNNIENEYEHLFPVCVGETLYVDIYQCSKKEETSFLAIRSTESKEGLYDCGHVMATSDGSETSGFILRCGHSFCDACLPILQKLWYCPICCQSFPKLKESKKVNVQFILNNDKYNRPEDIWSATGMGKIQMVKNLVNRDSSLINAKDNFGNTPLHFAAYYGKNDLVTFLLDSGASLEAKNNKDETPLFSAGIGKRKSTVMLLVKKGADFKVKNKKGVWLTPVCSSALRIFKFLTSQWEEYLYNTSEKMKYRVLWLDDNIGLFQGYFWEQFSKYDIGLVTSDNNDDVLKLLKDETEHFDLLVQDFQRPPGKCLEGEDTDHCETTGIVFYERFVHKLRPSLPCIYVTAEARNPRYIDRVDQFNNCYIFGKPIKDNDFKRMVKLIEIYDENLKNTKEVFMQEDEKDKKIQELEQELARIKRQVVITEEEFKGNPVLHFTGNFRPFNLGVNKCGVIIRFLDRIKEFYNKHKPNTEDTF